MSDIRYAFYEFEFGYLKIGYANEVVVSLTRADTDANGSARSKISDAAYVQIREYLDGKRRTFDFPRKPVGTEFQKRVWNALLDIPYGETRTYGEIAAAVGSPKACRAVGAANGKNPLWIVVPCHRVIGADGKLTGYAGGLAMKEALLRLERSDQSQPQT